ncbi:MAG: hypothetical protein ACRD5Z_15455, partial [Bryobacteraceae bacterium]
MTAASVAILSASILFDQRGELDRETSDVSRAGQLFRVGSFPPSKRVLNEYGVVERTPPFLEAALPDCGSLR